MTKYTPNRSTAAKLHSAEMPALRNTWYVACWTSELETSVPIARTIADEKLVFYRTSGKKVVALEDLCAHRWAPLSRGRVEGEDLRCMYHGVKYAVDGRCAEVPQQDLLPKALCVRAYPVVERYGFVWVWIGDATGADPTLVPNLRVLDEPQWWLYRGVLDYNANYALISDNLLDLTHVNFLHAKTLGRSAPTASAALSNPPIISSSEAKPLENGVRVEGWYPGSRIVAIPKSVPDGDLWARTDFVVPGIYISRGGMYPKGTATECNGLPPGDAHAPLSDGLAIHVVTPIAVRRSRYFYLQGFRASDQVVDEANAIWSISEAAFLEDVTMIEAQQANVAFHPSQRMGCIAADKGLVLFRTLMKRLIAEQMTRL